MKNGHQGGASMGVPGEHIEENDSETSGRIVHCSSI